MGILDRFKKKNKKQFSSEADSAVLSEHRDETVTSEAPDDSLDLSLSLSNTLSKESSLENTGLSTACLDTPDNRSDSAISNERIQYGDWILNTYQVTSDAILGGMGSVWRVHHSGWNTDLAMKRPLPRYFSEGGQAKKARFIAECESWIDLGLHPNIVSCYYVREIGGVPTIFSEWMERGSLWACIENGSLYTGSDTEIQARILDIAIQAARGLQYSHENGLLHLDMKPANLLLNDEWDAKVADFGLVQATSCLSVSSGAPSSGCSPAYCPAEQVKRAEPSPWMDVYAWALTVFEMYAEKRPWRFGAEVREHFDEYCAKCKYPIPEKMQALLKACLNDRLDSFETIITKAEELYRSVTGSTYDRKPFEKIKDTAATVNNRALSFLDIGQQDVALKLLQEAAQMESPLYNPAKWNLYLLSKRSGLEEPPIHPERGEEIFWDMEQGNMVSVCTDPRVSMDRDETPDAVLKPGDEEYRRMLAQLKELLRQHGAFGYAFKASAGCKTGDRILLGISASEREKDADGQQPQTMALRLIDADTYETLTEFEEPPEYLLDDGKSYRFENVGRVYLTDKYAIAVNANTWVENFSGSFLEHHRDDLGIHVWERSSGKYLKYIHGKKYQSHDKRTSFYERIGSHYFSVDAHGDTVYTESFEFHIPEGTAYNRYYDREQIKDESGFLEYGRINKYTFSDGFHIITEYSNDYGAATYLKLYPDGNHLSGKQVDSYAFGQISVDSERKQLLVSPKENRQRNRRVYLIQLRRIPYTASYIVAQVRSSAQAVQEYETVKKAESAVPRLLNAGKNDEALALYQNVRDNCWNIGYNKEILSLNPLFIGHAVTGAFDEVPYTEYAGSVRIPANKEQYANGKRFLIEYTGEVAPYRPDGDYWLDGVGNMVWYCSHSYESKPKMHPVFDVYVRENCVPDASYPAIKDNKAACRHYTLPEGLLSGAFSVGDDLIFCVDKPVLLASDLFTPYSERPGEKADWVPMTFKMGDTRDMYRLSLTDGSIERIGEITGFAPSVCIGGSRLFDKNNPRGLDRFRTSWTKECISSDGRLWMLLSEKDGVLLTPNRKWEPANGRPIEPFYTVESYEEKVRQAILNKGIRLFPPGAAVVRPREYRRKSS